MTLFPTMGPTNVIPYYLPTHQGMLSPQALMSPTQTQYIYASMPPTMELSPGADTMPPTPSPPTQHMAAYTTATPTAAVYAPAMQLTAGVPMAAPGIAMATPEMSPVGVSQQQHGQSYPMSVTTNMEVVWHGEFDRLFQFFSPTHWRLLPIAAPPQDELNIFQDSAKVRFQCGECGRGWTSMKGRVTFWLDVDEARGTGDIYFKLYGQQCKHCSNSEFEHAMWYPEEVVKVVFNLYMHIGQRYYNFQQPAIRVDRRQGKPRSQHDSKLCQACADGICKEAWSTAS